MQLPIALVLLVSLHSFTPDQVREDLDTHPWRPAPAAPVGLATAPTAKAATPVSAPAAIPAPTAATAAPTGVWQLQLAALSSLDAAKTEQKRFEKLLGAGKFEVFIDGAVYKVRYGAFASKDAAEAAREDLRAKGTEGFSVRKP